MDPLPLVVCGAAVALYALGRRGKPRIWREVSFYSGVPAPGEASGDAHRTAHDIRDPLSLVRAELVALSFYWAFLAGIAVISWIILYLI